MFTVAVAVIVLYSTTMQLDQCTGSHVERCSHINYHRLDYNCTSSSFCKKTFNISYITMHPYSPTLGVQDFIKICCANCTKVRVVRVFANISEVSPLAINTSNFVYPFLGGLTDQLVNGYYYIPVMHVPQAYYITMRKQLSLFNSILRLLPFVTVCLLMATVAGFFCWFAESRANPTHFPQCFVRGWLEGIWWSLVSMTTVGYGDRSPTTLIGRLFAVVWIFVGVTACGVLTAMLTTLTIEANSPKAPTMHCARVGVLNYRHYDALLVSSHGGFNVTSEGNDFESSVYDLVRKMRQKQIDGMLLDKYTLWSVIGNFSAETDEGRSLEALQREDMIAVMRNAVLSSVEYKAEVLTYGILVREKSDFDFLNDAIRSNRFVLEMNMIARWNQAQDSFFHRITPQLFDIRESYFQMAVLSLCAALGAICIFGLLHEYKRKRKYDHTRTIPNCLVDGKKTFPNDDSGN